MTYHNAEFSGVTESTGRSNGKQLRQLPLAMTDYANIVRPEERAAMHAWLEQTLAAIRTTAEPAPRATLRRLRQSGFDGAFFQGLAHGAAFTRESLRDAFDTGPLEEKKNWRRLTCRRISTSNWNAWDTRQNNQI
jgi:hypothetical protein